ncbi:MAG: tryptophanase [Bdellovibrionaceae bacterium]|nr:tryptophanase [Pseudobdellovibrionaceae bacterium]
MQDNFNTIIEPFKIKMVEAINMSNKEERKLFLKKANYNLFLLNSNEVIIDLLTDSGTGTMSSKQWAALIDGDESYAGSRSYHEMKDVVYQLSKMKHIFPTHQGRASERILFSCIVKKGVSIIPNNTHFDTTRANIEYLGGKAVDFTKGTEDPIFKGNMDLDLLKDCFEKNQKNIPLCMITITNNSRGGLPVSLKNIKETKALCDQFNIPLFIDACRFAENSYFIQQYEEAYKNSSILKIIQDTFSYCDGFTMSAKKDAIVNIGGLLCLNDDTLAEKVTNQLILTEGFTTYGGLAGRDMAAIAQGLKEVQDESYLKYRIVSTRYLGEAIKKIGIPIIEPIGGHAIYIDAKKMLPHIPPTQLPAQALACHLYVEGGVRSVEIGSLMFGKWDDSLQKEISHDMELLRLAIPRRTYTQSHIDYVIETFERVYKQKQNIKGLQITKQASLLRHFSAHLKPVE